MLTHTSRWSHARGNGVVPSRWQATPFASALGRVVLIVMVRLRISPNGDPVDIDDYQDGDLARVRWLSEDRLRMTLAYQGSKTGSSRSRV
jgi:hypothetical protein